MQDLPFRPMPRLSLSRGRRLAIALLGFLVLLSGTNPASAGLQETLPTYHWAYGYIDQLWIRGYFPDLLVLNRPYTRGEVARAVVTLQQEVAQGKRTVPPQDRWLLARLRDEFQPEIDALQGASPSRQATVGGYFIEDLNSRQGDFQDHFRYRTRAALSAGPGFEIYNGIAFDNRLDNDPLYLGKRKREVAGFTEQAYVRFSRKGFGLVLGRDFLRWGAGEAATLLISDVARPMDLFLASYRGSFFKFTFFTAMLDPMDVPVGTGAGARIVRARRYLAAHRLDLRLGRWLQLAATEVILYGGAGRSMEFAYLNPFLFFHGNLMNGPGQGNTFGSIDWYFLPARKIGFYGTFMIDDIQLEKTSPGDLEPNELGWLVGLRLADPGGLPGSNVVLEYTRVTNRTYNTVLPYEKFLHRNFPLGHYLGNDFDRWQLQWKQWVRPDLELRLGLERVRKGEGDVYAPFDTPWVNYTLEQGYHEPFPTGVVETTRRIDLGLVYHPVSWLRVSMKAQRSNFSNLGHVVGAEDSAWLFQLSLWWAPRVRFRMPE